MIGIVGERYGFPHTGGIQTLYRLLIGELERRDLKCQVLHAGGRPVPFHQLIVIGCSSPWAYWQIAKSQLKPSPVPIAWIPCFHPPQHVSNRWKARLARLVLRCSQRFGVKLYVLSHAELRDLDAGSCSVISLPFMIESSTDMEPEHAPLDRSVSVKEHDYDLVFLGRPVKQKGWHTFLTMVKQLSCRGLAMIPWQPEGTMPEDLEIRLEATNEEIRDLLGRSKILLLPSDYESFGFAQAEALNQGCCVPVLGEWPLWMDVSELIWKDLPITEWTVRLARLLDDETYLSKLAEAQRLAWKHRPERACSTLPMILSESFRP